jgi:4-carboxymuconolactone decarboxylase
VEAISAGKEVVMPWRNLVRVVGGLSVLALSACSLSDAGESIQATETMQAQAVVTDDDIPGDIFEDSWARLPLLRRETLDADGQRAYDVIVNPDSRYATGLRGPIGMWAYSLEMAENLFPASTYLRFGTEKDQRLTELVILATAREVRSQYEWSAHAPAGERAGLEPEIIDLVRRRSDLDSAGEVPGLGDQERTIIAFVREVVTEEKVTSATFARARELFGEQGVMDLAGLVGYYGFINITLKAFDVQLAPGRERLLPDLW